MWDKFFQQSEPHDSGRDYRDRDSGRSVPVPGSCSAAKNGREQLQQGVETDASLLDHLGSLREHVSRYVEANFLGDLETDDKLKFGWELDWEFPWVGTP